jgi:hypothetical protein
MGRLGAPRAQGKVGGQGSQSNGEVVVKGGECGPTVFLSNSSRDVLGVSRQVTEVRVLRQARRKTPFLFRSPYRPSRTSTSEVCFRTPPFALQPPRKVRRSPTGRRSTSRGSSLVGSPRHPDHAGAGAGPRSARGHHPLLRPVPRPARGYDNSLRRLPRIDSACAIVPTRAAPRPRLSRARFALSGGQAGGRGRDP